MVAFSSMKSRTCAGLVERYATKTERYATRTERYATGGGTQCHWPPGAERNATGHRGRNAMPLATGGA